MRDKTYLDSIQVIIKPVTRAHVKKFKKTINGMIQVTWDQLNL